MYNADKCENCTVDIRKKVQKFIKFLAGLSELKCPHILKNSYTVFHSPKVTKNIRTEMRQAFQIKYIRVIQKKIKKI